MITAEQLRDKYPSVTPLESMIIESAEKGNNRVTLGAHWVNYDNIELLKQAGYTVNVCHDTEYGIQMVVHWGVFK